MGLLDDYMNESEAAKPDAKAKKSSSIIDMYLNSPDEPRSKVSTREPKPPISGVSKEQSDLINDQPSKQGGANPRDSQLKEGIKAYPGNLGSSVVDNFKGAGGMIAEGAGEALSNKPASGVGKVGLGLLSGLTALPEAVIKETVSKPAAELTGNPEIGDRLGMVVGSGLPLAKATQATIAAIPKNKALSTLVESIGHENLPTVVREMKANPRLTPADLSAKVKQDTQHLFTVDGPHINYLDEVTKARAGTAKASAETAMDQSLGHTVDAVQKLKDLKDAARAVGQKEINPAVEGAKPVNMTPVIDYIDAQLKPGINSVISSGQLPSTEINKQLASVRKILTDDKSMRTDPKTLHDVQAVLRAEASNLLNSSDGQARRLGNSLMGVRNQIVSAIDDASGGKYKPALSNYRDELQIDKAFNHGHDAIIKNSRDINNRPEFFKEWVKEASPEELKAAKEGARIAIDTAVNGFRSPVTNPASKAVQMAQVDFNRQRIEALFGKEEAGKLFKHLDDERKIADTNVKLTEGSQTAMRSASKEKFALPTPSEAGKAMLPPAILEGASMLASGLPGLGTGAYVASKMGLAAKDAVSMKLAKEHNARYARYALPTEGPERDQLIQHLDAIANKPPKQSLLSKLSTAIQP
jgi:hypothetical protein